MFPGIQNGVTESSNIQWVLYTTNKKTKNLNYIHTPPLFPQVYQLEVQQGREVWTIYRRYSAVTNLNEQLTALNPQKMEPLNAIVSNIKSHVS